MQRFDSTYILIDEMGSEIRLPTALVDEIMDCLSHHAASCKLLPDQRTDD